jgi:signal transduction histidine kinase/CheY-like chemotaxis protein/HPt (histidine-containing phosphotransfer) domain-containing protein
MKKGGSHIRIKLPIRRVIGLGFGFALVILLVSGLISYKSTGNLLQAANGLSHAHQVAGFLKEIVSDIAFLESSEKGFLITGKDEYLNACRETARKIAGTFNALRGLEDNGSILEKRLELLEPLVAKRVQLMEETLEARQIHGYEEAFSHISSHKPKMVSESLRNIIGYMEKEEMEIISAETIKANIYSERIKSIVLLGHIIAIVVLGTSLLIIFLDISQRNFFEQELIKAKELAEKSVKIKENFLANISHEIRTPMNAISGLTKILLRSGLNKKQIEYLDAIKASSDTLLVIINDILDLSKAKSGKMVFEKTEIKIHSLVSSLTELLSAKAEEKRIKLMVDIDKDIPPCLLGDAVRLNQILLNLLGNAIKFTEKGNVELTATLIPDEGGQAKVKFSVGDSGIGITEELMPTIFESFTQASTEITRKYGGTGLGLSIVKELVELQGGQIQVKSKVGEGSTFSFWLPFEVKEAEGELVAETGITAAIKYLPGTKVLLVEDNLINQMVAQAVLKEFKCMVESAENGKTAFELSRRIKFDVILMDVQMPEISGYEVTRRIRSDAGSINQFTPIIAMTANAGKADQEKCMEAGMDDFISKPFDENNLLDKLHYWKGRKKMPLSLNSTALNQLEKSHLESLKRFTKGNGESLREVANLFIELTPLAMENMRRHCREENWQMLMAEAHKIKPSFTILGNKELEQMASRIEEASRLKQGLSGLHESVEALEKGCNNVIEELREELKQLSM